MSHHRITNRAKANARVVRTRRRTRQRQTELSAWLGAGALTLGLGAAVVAGGSAIAHADTAHAAGAAASARASAGPKAGTAVKTTPGGGVASVKHLVALPSAVPAVATNAVSALTLSPRSALAAGPPVVHPSLLIPAVKPTAVVAVLTSAVSRATAVSTLAAVTPPPSQSVTPVQELVNTVVKALVAFAGLNPTTPQPAPGNLVQLAAYSVARWLENTFNPAGIPHAGTPTVGTPDTTSGAVTFNPIFTTTSGAPLTYRVTVNPTQGSVTVNADGVYTYTPTTAEKFSVPAGGSTVPLHVTAYNGVQSVQQIINVPVQPPSLANVTIQLGGAAGLALSPNGTELVVTGNFVNGAVAVVNTQNPQSPHVTATLYLPEGGASPLAVAITPDGLAAYVSETNPGPTNGNLHIVALINNTLLPTTIGVYADPSAHAIAPGPSNTPAAGRLYLANYTGESASVINTATNTVIATIPVVGNASGVAVSPNGTRAYVTASSGLTGAGTVAVINTATNKVTATIPVGNSPDGVAVSPDGTHVYVGNSGDGTISVINTATNNVTTTIALNYSGADIQVAVSPDGSVLYATVSGNRTVAVIDTATNTIIGTIPTGQYPRGIAVSPDGNTIYVANELDGTVSAISV